MNVNIVMTLILLGLAIWYDIRTYTIPNRLTLSFIILGIVTNLFLFGLNASGWSLLTVALTFLTLFPLFAFRILGAGDIKLMMGVGAIMGLSTTFLTLVWGIVFGGILALFVGLFQSGLTGLKKTAIRYYHCVLTRTYFKPESDEFGSVSVPYAPALTLGFIYTCFNNPELRQGLQGLLPPLETLL